MLAEPAHEGNKQGEVPAVGVSAGPRGLAFGFLQAGTLKRLPGLLKRTYPRGVDESTGRGRIRGYA